jgi:hypothetical protein
MTRINRAAARAVATVALSAAVTFSAPSQAQTSHLSITDPLTASASPAATTPAGIDIMLDNVGRQVAAPAPAAEKKGLFATLWIKAAALFGAAPTVAPVPEMPRTLDELVVAYAGDRTADTEQDCLAKAVYFEARGEPLEGQLAVAQVVMNRAASGRYPGTLCEVVTQPWQFSFIDKGRFPTPDFGSESWRKAVAVARIAQARLAGALPSNVLWYHATYVSPSWGKRLQRTTQIGLHIFYS